LVGWVERSEANILLHHSHKLTVLCNYCHDRQNQKKQEVQLFNNYDYSETTWQDKAQKRVTLIMQNSE
jgi:hypothetical protein